MATAYISTVLAGTLAYFANISIMPRMFHATEGILEIENGSNRLAQAFFEIPIPPIMGVMTALVLAFTLGIGIAMTQSKALKSVMDEFQMIVSRMIMGIIIPLLPLYIMSVFANMTFSGQVASVFNLFSRVFIMVIALHLLIIVVQYSFAGALSKANPIKLIKTMIPAYLTAIGTQSSAATIPVTVAQTKKNGVPEDVASFSVPLCATIHLSGSIITIISCAVAIMVIHNMDLSFATFFGFIIALGVTMIAAPGVPGGAVMAALGLLQTMLGFHETLTTLMIALYLAQDSFGTACNITGDGAIAIIVSKILGNKKELLETDKQGEGMEESIII